MHHICFCVCLEQNLLVGITFLRQQKIDIFYYLAMFKTKKMFDKQKTKVDIKKYFWHSNFCVLKQKSYNFTPVLPFIIFCEQLVFFLSSISARPITYPSKKKTIENHT